MKPRISPVLTVAELAKYLHCSMGTVYRMAKRGNVPCFRIGTELRFRADSIREWTEQRERGVR